MSEFRIFTPFNTDTVAVSVSGSNASGTITWPSTTTSAGDSTRISNITDACVRVYNATNAIVFVNFNAAATTAKMPIAPGAVEIFQCTPLVTTIQAITAGGTGTIYATAGVGG